MAKQPTEPDVVRAYGSVEEIQPYRFKALARLVYSSNFELTIAFVILTNAVSLAILTLPEISAEVRRSAETIDIYCFWIYVVELGLRILSYGRKPWKFLSRGWNVFDLIVIGLAPFVQGQTAVLRLLRLLRLVRIFRFLPEVRVLSRSIIKSVPPLLSMTVLISLMLFLYGMAGYYLFGSDAPASWGDIGSSMKSLFILLTLENFPVYLEEALAINALALPYFLSYVFVVVFTVLNVLIGIVLNAMDEARTEDKAIQNQLKAGAKEKSQSEIDAEIAAHSAQISNSGTLTSDELRSLREHLLTLRNRG